MMTLQKRFQKKNRVQKGYETPFLKPSPTPQMEKTIRLSLIYKASRGNSEERLTEQGEESSQWVNRMTEITGSPRVSSPFNSPSQSETGQSEYFSLSSSSSLPNETGEPISQVNENATVISENQGISQVTENATVISENQGFRQTSLQSSPRNPLFDIASDKVTASLSIGRFLNIGGSRLLVSIIGQMGFTDSFSPTIRYGFNFGSDLGISPLEPKQIQGWGRNRVLRLDIDKYSFSYEWGHIFSKDHIPLGPFLEIRRGFSPALLEMESRKVRYSRLIFHTPIELSQIEAFCSKAKLQFTLHRDGSFFPFFAGTQARISFLYEPKLGEWPANIFGWRPPLNCIIGGNQKFSFCDDNNIKLLRGLSQLDQIQYTPNMGSNFQQNIFCASESLKDISQRQVAFEEQVLLNQRELFSRLEDLRTEGHFEFTETFGAIRDLERTGLETSEKLNKLVKEGEETNSVYYEGTKSLSKDLENNKNQSISTSETFFQAVLNPVWFTLLRSSAKKGFQGIAICVLVGGVFSVLYLASDLYVYDYHHKKKRGNLRLFLYMAALFARLAFPFGIFTSYILLMGNFRLGGRVPFLKLFEELPFAERGATKALFRGAKILMHPLRLYLAFLGLRFTKTRIFMLNHQLGCFAILLGSTVFFSYFRLKLDQAYQQIPSNPKKEVEIIAKQFFFLTTGIQAFLLIKEEVLFLQSIIIRTAGNRGKDHIPESKTLPGSENKKENKPYNTRTP